MNNKFLVLILYISVLSGCAGSATHQVVSSHQAGDDALTCTAIDSEIIKTQAVIDAIKQDKEDISGPDVVDTLLWFPFNLLAKSQNYKESLNAADRRIQRLQELRKERACNVAAAPKQKYRTSALSKELKELNDLYKSGALTADEYKSAKQIVLNNTLTSSPTIKTQSKTIEKKPEDDVGYPHKLTGDEIKEHYLRNNNFIFDRAPRADFTLKILSFNNIERDCSKCGMKFGDGYMNIKESQNQVCFYWSIVTYPSSGCFDVIQIEGNRYQLIDPTDGETYGYKVPQ